MQRHLEGSLAEQTTVVLLCSNQFISSSEFAQYRSSFWCGV